MRYAFVLGLATLVATAASAQNAEEAEVLAVLDGYHAALARSDSNAALALLIDDAVIVENGEMEALAQYRRGHLVTDMHTASRWETTRDEPHLRISGETAWVASVLRIGRQGTTITRTAELAVLVKVGGDWRISAFHWSSP